MKLYIRQRTFSWRDRFTVKDAGGKDRYYIEGRVTDRGNMLHIFRIEGQEAACISQKIHAWLPKFYICRNGIEVACLRKQPAVLHRDWALSGCGWRLEGDFREHAYSVCAGDRQIASVQRVCSDGEDAVELDVREGWDEVLTLAVALVIDCVMKPPETMDVVPASYQ